MSDNRRCTGDSCLASAGARSVNLDMPVATILMNPRQEWSRIASGNGRVRVAKTVQVDWNEYTQEKYLFSHVTAVASVATEKDGFTILPACVDLINSNGNAWTNELLLATFKSFIGGFNFLEHCQIEALSKGKILDAILRPVCFEDEKGNKADIYYCDLLVGTERKHEGLIKQIISGEYTSLSMGCTCNEVTCSQCGKVLGNNDANCKHLDNDLLRPYKTKYGFTSKTAELCGRVIWDKALKQWVGDPQSNTFIEISWVAHPAFSGAVLNHYVSDISSIKLASKYLELSTSKLQLAVDDIFKMRVADKNGMLVLRVAQEELARRIREDRISRIARNLF